MQCPRCRSSVPEVAHYCQVCGQDLRSNDQTRRHSFAAKPDEPVASFAVISSIMPRGTAGQQPQTYRIAFGIALVVALVAAIFGALPIAVLVAAFAIPIVYIVYLYDVNLWEDEPLPVTALAFGLTGLLAALFTWVWTRLVPFTISFTDIAGFVVGSPTVGTFLIIAVLVPVVGEAIRQIGPLVLASRPQFDDLMDGLTFGVISGVAYACFDTLVRHWALLTGGIAEIDPGRWVALIFLEGFIKPLIMGTATGIACAEFSGLGKGYDGFTPRYFGGLAAAIVANIAYQAGGYLFAFVGSPTLGSTLQILWALIILGTLLLRLRVVLHAGLMEAALEASARSGSAGVTGELAFCTHCEMPLVDHASFCNACGTAVRVQRKEPRPEPAPVGAAAESAAPAQPAAAGQAGDIAYGGIHSPAAASSAGADTGGAGWNSAQSPSTQSPSTQSPSQSTAGQGSSASPSTGPTPSTQAGSGSAPAGPSADEVYDQNAEDDQPYRRPSPDEGGRS